MCYPPFPKAANELSFFFVSFGKFLNKRHTSTRFLEKDSNVNIEEGNGFAKQVKQELVKFHGSDDLQRKESNWILLLRLHPASPDISFNGIFGFIILQICDKASIIISFDFLLPALNK